MINTYRRFIPTKTNFQKELIRTVANKIAEFGFLYERKPTPREYWEKYLFENNMRFVTQQDKNEFWLDVCLHLAIIGIPYVSIKTVERLMVKKVENVVSRNEAIQNFLSQEEIEILEKIMYKLVHKIDLITKEGQLRPDYWEEWNRIFRVSENQRFRVDCEET